MDVANSIKREYRCCCRDQIKDARPLIEDMEIEKRLDMAQVTRDAIKAVEETGIVFIDEIDKVGRSVNSVVDKPSRVVVVAAVVVAVVVIALNQCRPLHAFDSAWLGEVPTGIGVRPGKASLLRLEQKVGLNKRYSTFTRALRFSRLKRYLVPKYFGCYTTLALWQICNAGERRSADASAEGVQRDLLPMIEGSSVTTRHGNIDTSFILFIASGAFHSCKPSDMLAELQVCR